MKSNKIIIKGMKKSEPCITSCDKTLQTFENTQKNEEFQHLPAAHVFFISIMVSNA